MTQTPCSDQAHSAVPEWVTDVYRAYSSQGIAGRVTPRANAAVIVVDLVNGFTDPTCPPGSCLDVVVAATRRILDAARAVNTPVYFTTIEFDQHELDTTVWLEKMPALRVLTTGSPWTTVDARLGRLDTEPVLAKKAASAFAGTDLLDRLCDVGVGTVIVCGATTSGCVRATAVDACTLGLATFVPRPCVGDREAGPHEASLLDIDAKYGDVIDEDDARTLLLASHLTDNPT